MLALIFGERARRRPATILRGGDGDSSSDSDFTSSSSSSSDSSSDEDVIVISDSSSSSSDSSSDSDSSSSSGSSDSSTGSSSNSSSSSDSSSDDDNEVNDLKSDLPPGYLDGIDGRRRKEQPKEEEEEPKQEEPKQEPKQPRQQQPRQQQRPRQPAAPRRRQAAPAISKRELDEFRKAILEFAKSNGVAVEGAAPTDVAVAKEYPTTGSSGWLARVRELLPPPATPQCGTNAPMPHQRTLSVLCRMGTRRVLQVARTGSGKTLSMLLALEELWDDPRRIICVFPSAAVKRNFWEEMAVHNTRFKTYVESAIGVAPGAERIEVLMSRKGFLASRPSGAPAGPIRCYTYGQAGGGLKRDSYFEGTLDDKIVILDEAHSLVQAGRDETQRSVFAEALLRAQRTAVFAATATPASVSNGLEAARRDLRRLLDVVCTPRQHVLSYYWGGEGTIFPETSERLHEIPLRGRTLAKYRVKHGRRDVRAMSEKELGRLQNYCNTTAYHGQSSKVNADNVKLSALADLVVASGGKSLILLHRRKGLAVLADVFARRMSLCHGSSDPTGTSSSGTTGTDASSDPTDTTSSDSDSDSATSATSATSSSLGRKLGDAPTCWALASAPGARDVADFNKASQGVLIANAEYFSEGVSFWGVRHLWLVSPASSATRHAQQVGRATRACRHANKLTIHTLVATFPDGPTADEESLRRQKAQTGDLKRLHAEMREMAVEQKMVGPSAQQAQ